MSSPGCCSSISNWFYNVSHTPISRRNFVFGVSLLGIALIVVIILAVTLSPEGGAAGGGRGSDVLKSSPLVVGSDDILWRLKTQFKNQINNLTLGNLTEVCKQCQSDLTVLSQGLVAAQVWNLRTNCSGSQFKDSVSLLVDQIDLVKRLEEKFKKIKIVLSAKDLRETFDGHKEVGVVVGLAGGHALDGRASVLRTAYRSGVRLIALTEASCSPPWAGHSDSNKNLSKFGQELLAEMNRLGLAVDLSGSSPATQAGALASSRSRLLFTKSNAFALCNQTKLNLDDGVLELAKNKSALVMVSFTKNQLCGNGTMDDLIEQLNYLKEKLGWEQLGIGGNFDSEEEIGEDLRGQTTVYKRLFDELKEPSKRGKKRKPWTEKELRGLAGGNWLKLMEDVEREAGHLEDNEKPFEGLEPRGDFGDSTSCYSDFDTRHSESS